MPMNLSTSAKNRAADGIVQPIAAADGTLQIRQGGTVLVSFSPVRFPNPASNGTTTSAAINPADATASGVADNWRLLDSLNAEIANGVAGQRYGIISIDRGPDTIRVAGNRTTVFTPRANVTLHNKNDTTQNVYVTVDNAGSSYDSITDTTTINIFEDLAAPPYDTKTWTHIHVGELGMDNTNIQMDQRVSIDNFSITIK